MSYQVVIDATADLCPEMLEGLPEVKMISMDVTVGDQPYVFGPGGNITVEEFYRLQESGLFAGTSQINPAAYEAYFEKILQDGKDILYVGLTSGLSNSYHNSCRAAEKLMEKYPERKIICVDSACASVGEGFLAHEVLHRQAEGMSMEDLAQWIEERKLHVCHWFTVDMFDHLRHGGRVSAASATLGSVLNIKPLLCVDNEGHLPVKGKPRGRKQAMKAQIAVMKKTWTPEESRLVVIGQGDAMDRALELEAQVKAEFPGVETYIAPIGPVIGAHTGPGMLALIFWGTER